MSSRTCLWLLLFVLLAPGGYAKPLGIDTKGLDAIELKSLTTLLGQGACPCDKQRSILECVSDTTCPSAKTLAEFGARQFRAGLSTLEVQQAVVKKYIQDHVHYEFDVTMSPVKGHLSSPIKVVEFADFQCGHCAQLSAVIKELAEAHGVLVQFVFKQFPMTRHPFAHYAARASLAAHKQGQFWAFHDLLFAHHFELSVSKIDGFAKILGLDMVKYARDRESLQIRDQIAQDRKEAIAAGLRATPTLYINGRLYTESKSIETLRAHLTEIARGAPQNEVNSGVHKPETLPVQID